jgi:sensor c-di-GMP phosphodiesterase-like protein
LAGVEFVASKFRNLLAIGAGVLLLGLPSAIFNYRLNGAVERQSREELTFEARRTIALADSRIGQVIAILDDLAARGVNSCAPAHLDALRQATFTTTPVKEFSVVAPDGSTLCSDLNGRAEARMAISSEPAVPGGEILLDVVQLDSRPGQIVRIRRPGQGAENGLAALIPIELLISQGSAPGGYPGMNLRIVTGGGMVISVHPTILPTRDDGDVLTAEARSERYAIEAILTLRRASLAARENDARALGAIVTGILALVIFGFALLMPRRQSDNPITAIENALKAGEFVPYYQPIVDIRTGRLRGAEVLARWRKPDGTVLLPAAFIPLAESSGIILNLTRALMRQVSKDLGRALGPRPHLRVAFNVIPQHFADEELVNDVSQIFKHSALRLSQIVLEVTERQPIENLTETRRVIATLQGLGVHVAIDDVGTGHGGLSYMLKLGVDIIKIDKMFVDSLGVDGNSTAIVQTLIELAQSLRMDVVAEGVETYEQVAHLRSLGIRGAQGHVFAPPLPCSAFVQLIEAIDPLPKKPAERQAKLQVAESPSHARLG